MATATLLPDDAGPETPRDAWIGSSPPMHRVRRLLARVAPLDGTVLLLGETGTGKGLLAREIHARSRRAAGPFVHVDCASLSPTVIESELFGHERGAFTGAWARHDGRLERARGGTLFLDEVGELAPPLQAKLLSVLEERTFERVGGSRPVALDARVVAATNRDLARRVETGGFRRDLYFRLCVFPIEVPPLRARRGDLPGLVARTLPEVAARVGVREPRLAPGFLQRLEAHDWPGNVRELLHVLERALVLSSGVLDEADAAEALAVSAPAAPASADAPPSRPDAQAGDARALADVLRATGGNVSRAARRLGLARSTLRGRILRHGLTHLVPDD